MNLPNSLSLCRFSVNVFQPPFQSGRASPETSQCRGDHPPMAAGPPEGLGPGGEAMGGGNTCAVGDMESPSLLPESQAECPQASALPSGDSNSLSSSQTSLSTTQTADSGFSAPISSTSCCSLDPHAEKETSCEKAVRPEGNVRSTIGRKLQLFVALLSLALHPFTPSSPTSSSSSSCRFIAAAVTGYQHPSESASGHASQFYIALLDSDNKEQRLDERGMH